MPAKKRSVGTSIARACRKCGTCCERNSSPQIHKSERAALERFRKAGAVMEKSTRPGFVTVVINGKCVMLSKDRCLIHKEKPLVCKQAPFKVAQYPDGHWDIELEASICRNITEHVERNWKSAPKVRRKVYVSTGTREADVPEMSLTQKEIDSNPFLRNSFRAAEQMFEKTTGKKFKRKKNYRIDIVPYFFEYQL